MLIFHQFKAAFAIYISLEVAVVMNTYKTELVYVPLRPLCFVEFGNVLNFFTNGPIYVNENEKSQFFGKGTKIFVPGASLHM